MSKSPSLRVSASDSGSIPQVDAYRIGQRIATIGLFVNAVLATVKIGAGSVAHSTALTADGFETASDILSSFIIMGGMAIARRPADERFPYGYGRAESLAGKTVATVLLVFAALLGARSIEALVHPPPAPPAWALWPLAASIIAKTWMTIHKRRTGKRIGSSALLADAANDLVDILSAFVAAAGIAAAALSSAHFMRADPLGGLGVSLIILYIGLRIFRDTSTELMDVMPAPELVSKVRETAREVRGVLAVEKCFGRKSGVQYFFDLHIEVDPSMPVRDAHELGHVVQNHILEARPFVKSVLVHIEPFNGNDNPGAEL